MYEIEFQQRRRRAMARIGVVALIALVGLISVLPRSVVRGDATLSVAELNSRDYLLLPQPMSSAPFGAFVAPTDRGSLVR